MSADVIAKVREHLDRIAKIAENKVYPEGAGHDAILWCGDVARAALALLDRVERVEGTTGSMYCAEDDGGWSVAFHLPDGATLQRLLTRPALLLLAPTEENDGA